LGGLGSGIKRRRKSDEGAALSNALTEMIGIGRRDPLKWVRSALQVEPTVQQVQGLAAISKPSAHVSIRSGHGTGKSSWLSWLIWWFLCCMPDCKIPCTAPSRHQLQDILWSELALWYPRMLPASQRSCSLKTARGRSAICTHPPCSATTEAGNGTYCWSGSPPQAPTSQ